MAERKGKLSQKGLSISAGMLAGQMRRGKRTVFVPDPLRQGQSTSTPRRDSSAMQTMGMIFMNPWTAANMAMGQSWVINDIITSAVAKGKNWQYYKAKLTSMGYNEQSWIDTTDAAGLPAFQVGNTGTNGGQGEAACALASLFNKVALGHWPSDNVVSRIKALAASQGRTIEVGNYFINYETINQAVDFVPVEETLRLIVKAYLLVGTGPNTYGCSYVDYDELGHPAEPKACPPANAAGFTHHGWYADMTDGTTDLADDLTAALGAVIAGHYPVNRPGFFLVDNGLDRPNWGSATNEPVVADATFVAFYVRMLTAMATLLPTKKWSNRGETGVATYTAAQMPNRYGEFFMHLNGDPGQGTSKLLTTFQTELTAAKTNGILIALDHGYKANEVDLWSTSVGPGGTKGTWTDLDAHMRAGNLRENMIAVALRTSSGFYAKWQDIWGTL